MNELKRILLVTAGIICLIIAAVGVVVPFLPTVDFLLLAAWCFYRGSPRLHAWLLSLKGVGPIIRDWEEHRVIRPRGKAWSVIMLSLAMGYVVFFADIRLISRFLMGGLWLGIAAFILSRPSARPDEQKSPGGGSHTPPPPPTAVESSESQEPPGHMAVSTGRCPLRAAVEPAPTLTPSS